MIFLIQEVPNEDPEPQFRQHSTIENELGAKPSTPGSPPVGTTEFCHLVVDPNLELSQHWSMDGEPVDQNGNRINNVIGHPNNELDAPNLMLNGFDQHDALVDQPYFVGNHQGEFDGSPNYQNGL